MNSYLGKQISSICKRESMIQTGEEMKHSFTVQCDQTSPTPQEQYQEHAYERSLTSKAIKEQRQWMAIRILGFISICTVVLMYIHMYK